MKLQTPAGKKDLTLDNNDMGTFLTEFKTSTTPGPSLANQRRNS